MTPAHFSHVYQLASTALDPSAKGKRVLRQFMYRDDPLIREFLAQVEGGLFDEDTQVHRASGKSGLGAGVKVGPAKATGERSKDHSEESQRVIRQTGASEFERFYRAGEGPQYLDAIDEAIWGQLQRGEIVELEGVLQPTGLSKVAALFDVFEQLLPIARAAGAGEALDPEAERILSFVKQLAEANPADTLPMIVSLASSPGFKFAVTLRIEHLIVEPDVLEGEATVCGKIQRKLREEETYMVGAVFAGLEQLLDEGAQAQVVEAFENPAIRALGLASPKLVHPAAILTPLAIYR